MAKKERKFIASFVDLADESEINFNTEKNTAEKPSIKENIKEEQHESNKESEKVESKQIERAESKQEQIEKIKNEKKEESQMGIKTSTEFTQQTEKQIQVDNIKQPQRQSDIIAEIVEQKKKRDSRKLIGIYFDSEVAEILNMIGEKGGKGAKSRVVNDAVKRLFIEQGLL